MGSGWRKSEIWPIVQTIEFPWPFPLGNWQGNGWFQLRASFQESKIPGKQEYVLLQAGENELSPSHSSSLYDPSMDLPIRPYNPRAKLSKTYLPGDGAQIVPLQPPLARFQVQGLASGSPLPRNTEYSTT